jgi:histidinol-phosphatase (PHP family)
MDYLFDYHIHSSHSTDGNDTVFEICKAAIKRGLREIVVTDHFEPTINNRSYPIYKPYDYWLDVALANEYYKKELKVKIGVELGQPHLFLDTSGALTKQIPYDYVIGSAHKFPSGLDCSEINYLDYNIEDICNIYLLELKELAETADFDCIGHFDLIKRYCTNIYNKRITLSVQLELLTEVFKILIAKGKGIEINTSGFRQTPKETMPGVDVLRIYRELGGEILTLGSDAHYAKDVGAGIQTAIENAKEAGFKYLTLFDSRKPEWVSICDSKDRIFIEKMNAI